DSACSATAYLGGVKANLGTIGVSAAVSKKNCTAMNDPENHVDSIARLFQLKGKSILKSGQDPTICQDIARQLIFGDTGKNLQVILGGGRKKFLPKEVVDEEGKRGERSDGANLIEEWKKQKERAGVRIRETASNTYYRIEAGKNRKTRLSSRISSEQRSRFLALHCTTVRSKYDAKDDDVWPFPSRTPLGPTVETIRETASNTYYRIEAGKNRKTRLSSRISSEQRSRFLALHCTTVRSKYDAKDDDVWPFPSRTPLGPTVET
ncbi:unnamed protein product, partial [Phaedon cochleariae]